MVSDDYSRLSLLIQLWLRPATKLGRSCDRIEDLDLSSICDVG